MTDTAETNSGSDPLDLEAPKTGAAAAHEAAHVKVGDGNDNGSAGAITIPKPSGFDLNKFRSKRPDAIASIDTLLTALPIMTISQARDFVRLHPDQETCWSAELCFVEVPMKGAERYSLHLIEEDLAMRCLSSGKILRFRLALATKPNGVFFLCRIPTRNLDNYWNRDNVAACEQATTAWTQATSRRKEGIDGYLIEKARDPDAFPEPKWPEQPLPDLIERAFDDRMIDSEGHPALLRLIGAKQSVSWVAILTISSSRISNTRSVPVSFQMYCVWWRTNWTNISSTYALSACGAEISARSHPFDVDPDTLFVAYSAWAEMTCFKVLGWTFPTHIFDQHTAYLAASNILLPYNPNEVRKRPRKSLADACRAYRIEGWERIEKDTIAEAIGQGRWRDYGRELVFDYCEEDVRMSVRLLRAQLQGYRDERGCTLLPPADVERVLHWSDYSAKAVALIQARGMPIDVALWNLVQENKAAVVRSLVEHYDPSQSDDKPIYTPEGESSYERFERHLVRNGIRQWPRLDSGKLDISGDAFRLMYHVPGMEALHALRDSLNVVVKATLPIGRDGRNRPSLFPFCTATGRNAHSKSLYNNHACMRSFMVFPTDTIGVYLDWRTQEVGIAAALSEDQALIDAYRLGDVYHALALVCGFTDDPDPVHWKQNNQEMRSRMKRLQLAINYGMGVPSLAKGLDRHPLIASTIIEMHQCQYQKYWQWREDMVNTAMVRREMRSVFGWRLRISTSPNKRTLYNFPMQSNGAEMLRLAACRLCEVGIVPCMLIHDGLLIEARDMEQVEHAKEIMRKAGREVCDGLEIGVDTDQELHNGARYRDKRPVAKKMWETMMRTLQEIGALPEGPLP